MTRYRGAQAAVPPLQAAAVTVAGAVQFLTGFENEVSPRKGFTSHAPSSITPY